MWYSIHADWIFLYSPEAGVVYNCNWKNHHLHFQICANFLHTIREMYDAEAEQDVCIQPCLLIPRSLWGVCVCEVQSPQAHLPRRVRGCLHAHPSTITPQEEPQPRQQVGYRHKSLQIHTFIVSVLINILPVCLFLCQYDVSVWCRGEQECYVPHWESTPPAGRQLPGVSESCQTQPRQRILHQWLITGSAYIFFISSKRYEDVMFLMLKHNCTFLKLEHF